MKLPFVFCCVQVDLLPERIKFMCSKPCLSWRSKSSRIVCPWLQGPKHCNEVLRVVPASKMKFKHPQETWNKLKIKVIGVGISNSPLQYLNTTVSRQRSEARTDHNKVSLNRRVRTARDSQMDQSSAG